MSVIPEKNAKKDRDGGAVTEGQNGSFDMAGVKRLLQSLQKCT